MNCPSCSSPRTQKRGTRRGKQRYFCNDCRKTFSVEQESAEPTFLLGKRDLRSLEKHERFVITSAQNNTPVDRVFWESLRRLANERGAKLLVVPVRYKNPTSRLDPQDDDEDDVWWPDEVGEFLIENEAKLHPKLWLLGDVRVQATAINPLTGLEALSGGASAIIGHAQIAMRTVPTPQNELPKIMHTTGSCSVKNYSKTKAGKKGWFHHSLGALLVEKEGSRFHLRVVNGGADGTFYDLNRRYSPEDVQVAPSLPALVLGDLHAGSTDPGVMAGTFHRPWAMVRELHPELLVYHDLFDGASCNPHTRGDVFNEYARWQDDAGGVEGELRGVLDHLEENTPDDCTNIVVASNHDDFLKRYLRDTRSPGPQDALVYHELMYRVLKETRMTDHGAESPNPLRLWLEPKLTVPTRFLGINDSLLVKGVELGMHGHRGPNGARGSLANLSRIGVKSMFGHGHGPGILWGAYQVGTSSLLRLDYNAGPSSWLHTHGLVLPNGKRQLINLIDGYWRDNAMWEALAA